MDAGEYDTNTLLINNLSSIAYRIYEPVIHASSYTFNASDVEHALRNDGHLVYMDSVRRGIWCFYLCSKSKDITPSVQAEQLGLTSMMEVCGFPVRLVEEGGFDPIQLLKGRVPGPNPINTPSSSSSSGSALEMTFRGAQSYSLPPGPVSGPVHFMVDGNVPPAPIKEGSRFTSIPIPEIHEFFITALLATLSASFCRRIGAIPLNHRTVLLPPEAFHLDQAQPSEALQTSALATFRIYLTTTGSLIISNCVSVIQGLVSSADLVRGNLLPTGSIVLAAPLGAFGAVQGIVDAEMQATDSGIGQSPDTQISRIKLESSDKFSQWKSTCSKMVQARGMPSSLLQNCSWLNVHFLQRRPYEQRADGKRTPLLNPGPTAPWPALLCFRKPRIGVTLDSRLDKGSLVMMEHLDPLNNAKTWDQGFSEKENAIARRKKEREVARSRDHAEQETTNPQQNGYSPMVLRRSSNGGGGLTSGTMYPTPPDGIQQSGVPSSFDPAVLSPGNPPPIPAPLDPDTTMHNEASVGDSFGAGWNGGDIKREPPGANFLEGDNMFEDLGDDMFEANELTDADFNFFDEEPVGGDMDLSVLPELGSAMDLSAALSQHKEPPPHPPRPVEDNKAAIISPQFTKPELKHARSTLTEESRQQANTDSFNSNSAVGLKRYPSPFTPDAVYKRICASVHVPPPSKHPLIHTVSRRGSVFEKVDFDPSLSLAIKKYQESGPFKYTIPSLEDKEDKLLEDRSPLMTGNPSRTTRQRGSLREPVPKLNLLWAKIAGGSESSPTKPEDLISNSDDSDWDSDQDGRSEISGSASSPAKSSIAKRRPDDDTISMAASFKDLENTSADSPAYGSVDLVRLSRPEIPEISMTKFFMDPEPAPLRLNCSDEDFMTVAQILTEQVATGSLRFAPQTNCTGSRETRRGLVSAARYIIQGLRKALPKSLAGATECQLRPFIEVKDVPLLAHPNRVQAKPPGQENVRPNIFQLPPPHMEFRRYDARVSVLPPALSFWETLGLGASEGPKDIVSIGVFPAHDGMRDSVAAYLDRVGQVYQSLKLGTHSPLPNATGIADGLLPFINDHEMPMASPGHSLSRGGSALSEYMMRLGQALASSTLSEKNFVVYFVYSLENPSTVVEYCAAFQELFEHYKVYMADRKKEINNDLVLQLVPQDLVASETSMVILSPPEYANLCIETYDRCTLFKGSMPAPAIVLEPAVPRQLDFKSTATPSPNLLQENSCVHVAYAQSIDERWITAAWTDNRGRRQMTASYCLGRRDKPLTRQLTEVLHEIWDTTVQDFISFSKVHWRVIVTKCGPMDQQEVEYWVGSAQSETKATVSLALVTVDTNPSLQLIPPSPKIPLNTSSVFYTTPVSTPQPNMVSPEQSGNNPATPIGAATPGGADNNLGTTPNPTAAATDSAAAADADSTLVDITDTTWGVVSSHRLNNSSSLTELNSALASGYLVKRTGPSIEDAPVAMEVNVIHVDPHPHGMGGLMMGNNMSSSNYPWVYENLLREMLVYFRGLGALARARGTVLDGELADVRPWHVAVVEKCVSALYLLM